MKRTCASIVTGVAVALAVLGLQREDGDFALASQTQLHWTGTKVPAAVPSDPADPSQVYSQSDANTSGTAIYLTQNVIDGDEIVLCAARPSRVGPWS